MRPETAVADRPCGICRAAVPDQHRYCWRCGYAQRGTVPAGNLSLAALLDARPSLRAVIKGGVAVAAVTTLAVAILLVRVVFFGPEDTVRDYFDALAERDADRAWSVLDGASTRPPLMSAAALAEPGYHPPADLEIVSLRRDDGRVLAEVSFEVAGTPQQLVVGVAEDRRGLLRRWQIDEGLYDVVLDGSGTTQLSVAGVRLAPEQDPSLLSGFPGGYQVTAAEHPLLDVAPVTAIAGGPPAEVSYQLRPDAGEQVEREVYAYLDQCLESRQLQPDGCQLEVFSFDAYEDVSWSLIEYPALSYEVQRDGTVFVAGEGGRARVTGTAASPFSLDLDDVVELPVSGWAGADGGGIWFEPDL